MTREEWRVGEIVRMRMIAMLATASEWNDDIEDDVVSRDEAQQAAEDFAQAVDDDSDLQYLAVPVASALAQFLTRAWKDCAVTLPDGRTVLQMDRLYILHGHLTFENMEGDKK